MKNGWTLHLPIPYSECLRENIKTIQDIWHCWEPGYHRVAIEAPSGLLRLSDQAQGVGCFFSGGVDSFYTLLKHPSEITHLIFVHGFDIPLQNHTLRGQVSGALREVAAELKLPLIEVETNLREFSERQVAWPKYHGAALAAIAHLLAPVCGAVYLPTSHTYSELPPWGTHPLLDPLWGSENLHILHDGCEATRVEKVASIAQHEIALRHLRVCWENREGAYNCGRCEKCLRTMLALHIAGALERCRTFPNRLNPADVAHIPAWDYDTRHFLLENLEALEQKASDPALAQAVRDSLNLKHHRGIRRVWRGGVRRLRRMFDPD
jgi:hypothetical protein